MADETADLAELRDEIDRIDDDLVDLIAKRVRTAERVAEVKSDAGTDLVDEGREAVVRANYADNFRQQDLDPERGRELADSLIALSLAREREVVRDK
ncbi:chorismate mutase [Halomicrobium zhouii]|uniref:Chorismate mutase n=1 Tax=Halomicrobium zhouii TaxID=767519 RepID=A0A1I6K1Y1_9EURY|nr:chorismate mutase [Halomicrobium zhouii]SFR85216.1 chorismate mutase [Halomicrobium zhouii]